MGIQAELQNLRPSALIDLIEIDATQQGGDIMRFHAGTNEVGTDIVWQGQTYVRYPVEVSGFEQRGSGALPRPTLRLSNANGLLAAEARQFNYFLGAKFTRKRTFARFLDSANFPGGNPEADPTQSFRDEVWYVDRKSMENSVTIEYELASALDLMGVALPRRQIIQNTCAWAYRDANCNYQGGPVATVTNTPTTDPALDKCSKTLSGCKLRFGTGRLSFGGFPGCGLVR